MASCPKAFLPAGDIAATPKPAAAILPGVPAFASNLSAGLAIGLIAFGVFDNTFCDALANLIVCSHKLKI